jgi:hypothetical protein
MSRLHGNIAVIASEATPRLLRRSALAMPISSECDKPRGPGLAPGVAGSPGQGRFEDHDSTNRQAPKATAPSTPSREGLGESDNTPMISFLDRCMVDDVGIIGPDSPQRDFRLDSAARSPNVNGPDDAPELKDNGLKGQPVSS